MTEKFSKDKLVNKPDTVVSTQRREVFKKAVVVGGMSMAVQQWTKPVVDSVVLPVHAATSLPFVALIQFEPESG